MGRAPCCEKMGLKKGPWTPEEDQILISYIHQHGHSNWRALPKHAGLLRCGKSCRLRWVNYLKPDIKRGDFTPEEEENIIKLHEMLGNRWSAIAARLPGRTDNEIKNVWHTHLKKRLSNNESIKEKNSKKKIKIKSSINEENKYTPAGSPQQSTTTTTTEISSETEVSFPVIDESFWTESIATSNFDLVSMLDFDYSDMLGNEEQIGGDIDEEMDLATSNFAIVENPEKLGYEEQIGGDIDEEMDFWYNVFIQAGGSEDLPEF